jgi:hypothetical protein
MGGAVSFARAINAGGEVAGQLYGGDAFLWTPRAPNGTTGRMKDLGTLKGFGTDPQSAAYGINDFGYVVGTSGHAVPGEEDAFYWPGSGGIQKLSDLVPVNSNYLDTATGINNGGQIAAYSTGATNRAFLLTPTSSPVQIGSFTASPDPVTAGSLVTLTAANITDANPGATITHVAFYVQINGNNTLLGYGTQTSPGVWTFNYTVTLPRGSYTLFAQAEDSYGVFGDLAATTLTVQ